MHDTIFYSALGATLEKLDILGIPISVHFNQNEKFKAKTGGLFSIILYAVMSYVLVYLSIRVFRGNTFEISETIIDTNNVFLNQIENPFDDTQFNIAYQFDIELKNQTNSEWFYISSSFTLNQFRSGIYDNRTEYQFLDIKDQVRWNETHFSEELLETNPRLRLMRWIPPGFNLSGSTFAENEYNSIVILFYYQYDSSCPLSFEEYVDNIQYASLNLIVTNENFDPSNIDNPIWTVINDNYNTYFSPKVFNRYLLSIQKNSYEIETGDFISQK